MASNRSVLDVWLEMMRAELEALVHVPVTARATEEIPSTFRAYRSQLLFEGPVQGVMYVTASASSLVQLSQMVAGDPVDPKAPWTEAGLEVWQIWLTATSGKLATRLSQEIAELSQDACTILLRGTTAVDGMHLASGTETTASGAAVQEWLLQAGTTVFILSVSAQVKFPGDDAPSVGVDAPEPEKTIPEPVETVEQVASSPEPVEAADPAGPAREPQAEVPLANAAALPRENPQAAQPVDAQSRVDAPPTSRKAEVPPASDPAPSAEPRTQQRLDLLLDIELEATLRFGALELPLREVLELGPGDVLPLDRHVREPVELVVGDRIVAKGEVVLVGGKFALHVTEVAEPRRRLETIRCLF